MTRRIATALAALLLGACGEAGDEPVAGSFPAEPYAELQSESGALKVAVRTSPSQPPAGGLVEVEYSITDASGKPVDGLSLDPVSWMPAMNHGASVKPQVEAEGQGRYRLTNVNLFMTGRWELRTRISGPVDDRVTPAFDVR